jgi:hypothetical protein
MSVHCVLSSSFNVAQNSYYMMQMLIYLQDDCCLCNFYIVAKA